MTSAFPSAAPTMSLRRPSAFPSTIISSGPSTLPSLAVSSRPSPVPSSLSQWPTASPSLAPSTSLKPSTFPSFDLTQSLLPSGLPSLAPSTSAEPSLFPSSDPTQLPSLDPSSLPSTIPSTLPTRIPSTIPSTAPSAAPSASPTAYKVGFDVIGSSGKFSVSTRHTETVIQIDSLFEIDANGDPVGTSGSAKHSLQTFASQEFAFGSPYEAPYDVTIGGDGIGPNASILPFTSTVSGDVGQIDLTTFIFKEPGTVTTDGSEEETLGVSAGDFKWNIELSNWSFCGVGDVECKQGQTQQVGAGIDVTMEMKGSSNAIESSNGRKAELGGGIEVFVSKMLYCDDEWIPIESGYPLFSVQGSKQLWTIRFPRFNSSCTYDPLLNSGAVLAEEIATSSPSLLPSALPSLQVDTEQPSELPSAIASASPSLVPTVSASNSPSWSMAPSSSPTAYEVVFDVLGQSGKFKVSTRRSNVTVAIESLYEVDSNADPVGTTTSSKHSVQTFANQEFVFENPYESPYGGEGGPMASTLPFASSVSDIGAIQLETFIFKEDGSITTDGSLEETANVTVNDFKFNVKLSDWSFCGVDVDCKKGQTFETGDGIIVNIEIKGTSDDALVGSGLRSYELGGGIEMFVSKMLFCDGEWIPMESGYPLFTVQGSKQVMAVKIPRFNSSCTYDPLLNTGAVLKEEAADDNDDDDDDTSGTLELVGRLGLHYLIALFTTLLYLAA